MNTNDIVKKIMQEFETLEYVNSAEWDQKTATVDILTALCNLGKKEGYKPCASSGAVVGKYRHNSWKEWLWDVAWLECEKDFNWLESVPLVAECEWDQTWSQICEDFPKLLVARSAKLRVMVCSGKVRDDKTREDCTIWLEEEEVVKRVCEWIRRFKCTKEDDAYLIVTCQWHKPNKRWYLRYFNILSQDSGESPYCDEIFPGIFY